VTQSLILAAVSASCLAISAPALADQTPELATVVVSANRVATPEDQVAASVAVIDAATLKSRQTVILAEALADTAGVTLVRNGGPGQTTTLRIRGAESEQTVVLLDGVRLNDPASPGGGFDFSNLLAGDVASVEILRGPQSTLWGADAIGGVVSISTTAPTAALTADASADVGGNDTRYGRASAGGSVGRLSWRIAGSYYQTSGVSAVAPQFGGKEKDGALNATGSARFDLQLNDWASLDLRLWAASAKAAFDGFPPPTYSFADTYEYGESRQSSTYAGLKLVGLDKAVTTRFSVQDMRLDRDNFDPTQSPRKTFYARGESQTLAWQSEVNLAPDIVAVVGAEHERSDLRTASPASWDPNPTPLTASSDLNSAFVSGRARLARGLTLSLGLRQDDHDRFGGHGTATAGAAYTPDDGVTVIRTSFGQGFKAPTLYQLYGDYGNQGLKPETANGYDLGITRRLIGGAVSLAAEVWRRDTRQQIGFFGCYPTVTPLCASRPFGYYDNVASAWAEGVEAELKARLTDAVTVTANYSHVDTENRSPGSDFGKALPRRPQDTAFVDASWNLPHGATLAASVRYSGEAWNNTANTVLLKAYVLADLRASLPLSPGVELYGRVENLFDRTYQTAYQYGSVGRTAYLGVRARY
jgi:vitamin B12 transporter